MHFTLNSPVRMFFSFAVATAALAIMQPSAAIAGALDRYVNSGDDRLVIRGFDATAYARRGRAQRGSQAHRTEWKGATWWFASSTARRTFEANPTRFAPQFGAYCTGGLSQRHVIAGNPQNWRRYKGRVYLFYSQAGARRFDKDPAGTLARAKAYWSTLNVKRR
ncbi:MAG: YHS domain-containing (seleno)protein [Pseudomonadota bacterium]